ncbi:MAG: imelysin [Prevotella sp.]|nr:imelysin [Prevotella sp.]
MNKILKLAMLFVAAGIMTTSMVSCSSDDENDTPVNVTKEQNEAIEALVKQYLNDVVYPTYTNLANESENLYNKISALKVKLKAGTTVNQSEIDAICISYKTARKYWEQSEAFLYGAASDFEIDPHIDTWPLDVPTLGEDLTDDAKIARLDAADGIEYARTSLTAENLGFHGIEFIFFRDGKNRSAAFFNNDEKESNSDITAKGDVTGKEEVIFATAVAGDLRDKCFQLEVAWNPNANATHKSRVAECAKTSDDFETKVSKNGLTYGENLMAVNAGNSTYNSWKKVIEEILVGGCSNICAEVADQKMGQAYRAATGTGDSDDDPNYIESPYSHNSFTDFYGNIMSIQNALYNNVEGTSATNSSVMSYLMKYNPTEASALQTKLTAALAALQACQNSGKSFVENPGATCVKTAMEAIGELDNELNAAANWILKN